MFKENQFLCQQKNKNEITSMDQAQILFREKVDKTKNYTSIPAKEKVDRLLFMNADQYCNLGKESTKTERAIAESNSRYIYRAIKELDERLGVMLLKANEE